VLAIAVWFGLTGGFVELLALVLKCNYLDPRYYNVSRHFPWMYPMAGVIVLALPGLFCAILAWRRRLSVGWAVGLLSFPVYLGLSFRWPILTLACLPLAAGLAAQTGRLAERNPEAAGRIVRRSTGFFIGILAALVVFCFGQQVARERLAISRITAASASRPNVLWLVLDTVAAEHLSLYGFHRNTSPNLERFASRGISFDLAISPAPWTTPAHASMFTGQWCHNLSATWKRPLDRSCPTLAELLSTHGYATAGFVANTYYCSYETGLDRGFAHYEDYEVTPRAILLCSGLVQRFLSVARARFGLFGLFEDLRRSGSGRKSAARLNQDFLSWLDRRAPKPFFAFLNFYDAHHPYLLPDPHDPHVGQPPRSRADYVLLRTWWEAKKGKLSPEQLAMVRDAYDSCIASLDHQLGRLFGELEHRGLLANTYVIVTADHGEQLGEHGLFGHGCSLYRRETHVPLVIFGPGIPFGAERVQEPVSLRDLPATVVDLLGIPGKTPFPGASLARYWRTACGTESPANAGAMAYGPSEPVLSELAGPPEADPNHGRSPAHSGPMQSVWANGLHYIRNGNGREELYDVNRDPAEAHNLADTDQAAHLLVAFRRHVRTAHEKRAQTRAAIVE
jgi:arylsulfatase A-like enzyme